MCPFAHRELCLRHTPFMFLESSAKAKSQKIEEMCKNNKKYYIISVR